ncbi:hypothetical protein DVR12_07525 [Chitinophaga silvatica]|uniref:PKD domain-containing protein n=1 Tax=Chitinophaga silvatica TaxID=2282649 RepID=A0A3E1YFD4_9BACT|nr:PKD domain-containing protein [Chitinophaga silvatica]RFS25027.1 hypothetical protein DVR12_07525 [Chitinophaga silvatica]
MESPIFTSSFSLTYKQPLDKMVLRTFAVCISIVLTIFCIYYYNRKNCYDTDIKIPAINNIHLVGEVITLIANGKNITGAEYQWEFGDNYAAKGQQVYHSYNKAGIFRISLLSGKCRWSKEIKIISFLQPPKDSATIFPTIEGPASTLAGKPTKYFNNTPQAKSWFWCLVDQDTTTYYSTANIELRFTTEGDKLLSLIINNDSNHLVSKRITVIAPPLIIPQSKHSKLPDTQPATNRKAPDKNIKPAIEPISEEEFKFLLTTFSNKQCNIKDLLYYLCNAQIKVNINGNEVDSFNHFCERIIGKKKLQIDQLTFLKEENGCIKEIYISYNKKKILGLF